LLSVELSAPNDEHRALLCETSLPHLYLWREKVVQWCYDLIDSLQENRAVVYVALNILDRYSSFLSKSSPVDEQTYELASMSSVFLAVGIAGAGVLRLPDLISMSRLGLRVQDIVAMGTSVVGALSWEHRFVTPFDFFTDLLSLVPSLSNDPTRQRSLHEAACYMAEIAVFDISLSANKASEIAIAAVLSSLTSPSETVAFGEAVLESTGISTSSSLIQSVFSRLRGISCLSIDSASTGPHVVPDDGVDGSHVSRGVLPSVPTVSVEDLTNFSRERVVKKRSLPICTEQPPLKRTKKAIFSEIA
jgi:Cyclin, N-terminal domain